MIPLVLLALSGCGPSRSEIKDQREQAQYHYDLAYGYFFDKKTERGEAALLEILKSIEIKEDNADAHLLAGLVFMGRRRPVDAIRHYRRSLVLQPDLYYAQNNLAAAYLSMERYDEAIKVLQKLAGTILYDQQGHAQNNLGWAYFKKGDLMKARKHFHDAIMLTPQLCPPRNNLGMLYLKQNKLELADKYLRQAIERCPSYAEPAYHMGRLLFRRGDSEAARKHFELCLKYAGESPLADQCAERLRPIRAAAGRREAQ